MAPEIRNGQIYDGRQVDVFSLGVVLFILVRGMFPFVEARSDDKHYNLICTNQSDKYWAKTYAPDDLSKEFRDLSFSLLGEDPSERPTLK